MSLSRDAPAMALAALTCLTLCSCRAATRAEGDADAMTGGGHFGTLVDNLTGWFTSAEQARHDPDEYHEIRLVMTPIWRERSDAAWFYVEQAAAEALDRPYRQRVYRVSPRLDGRYESAVYTLPGDPLEYAAAWREARAFVDLSPDDLVLRAGCAIELEYVGDATFVGSTVGKACKSSLAGAVYATSEVVITPERLESWDRGFDADGEQVWGATEGPYVFEKVAFESPGTVMQDADRP